MHSDSKFYSLEVIEEDLKYIAIIACLAGCWIHSVCCRLKCAVSKINFVTEKYLAIEDVFILIHKSYPVGLRYPIWEIIIIVAYDFIILQKLISKEYEKLFLSCVNEKRIVSCVIIIQFP